MPNLKSAKKRMRQNEVRRRESSGADACEECPSSHDGSLNSG